MPAPSLATVERPRAWGYGAALGDRLFRLAVGPGRELTMKTAPLEPPRINTTSSAEEATSEFGLTFSRSQFDGGGGLFRAHVEGADPNRYWDSEGVSVVPARPGEFPEVRLLHATENIEASASTGLHMAEVNGSVYLCEGTVLRRADDVSAATVAWVNDDPHAGEVATTVEDVAGLGDQPYAALGANGIHRATAGTWAHWSDVLATRVWAAKGRIVASDGTSLYEVVAAGAAPSPLKTLAPGETWQDVVDGGSHILAAASDGYVYAFSTETGSMALSGQSLFEGETPRSLGQSQGIVGIGTSSSNTGRFWVGQLTENGQLGDLQLIKEWGITAGAVDRSPRTIIGTRDTLLTGVQDGAGVHLWSYQLATAGFSRYLSITGTSGLVRGLLVLDGVTFASVDGGGVWRESSEYVDSGYLIGPLGDFYSAKDKSWIGARLETGDIHSGMRVTLWYTTDPNALDDPNSSSWTRVVSRDSGSGDPGEHALTNVISRSLAGMVKLTASSDNAETPAVRSFTFRAYASSGEGDIIITLPINVSDQVERRGKQRIKVPGRGAVEYQALLGLEGKPVTLRVYLPKQTLIFRGLVEEVATPIQGVTTRGSATVVSLVTVRGRRSGAGTTSGDGAFGTFHPFGTAPTFSEMTS